MTISKKATIAILLVLASPLVATESMAQTSSTTSGSNMWGTQPGGVSVLGALDSAIAHAQNGVVAGQVNSARDGLLAGQSIVIQSIGTQSIIQTTVNGSNNSASAQGTQTSTNTGAVTNTGTVQ